MKQISEPKQELEDWKTILSKIAAIRDLQDRPRTAEITRDIVAKAESLKRFIAALPQATTANLEARATSVKESLDSIISRQPISSSRAEYLRLLTVN